MKFIILDNEIVNISQAYRVAISKTENESEVYAEYIAGVDSSTRSNGRPSTCTVKLTFCSGTFEECKKVIERLGRHLRSDEATISIEQLTDKSRRPRMESKVIHC